MTIVLSKHTNLKELKAKLRKMAAVKAFDARKYSGVISLSMDPLLFQKRVRDEWD